MKAALCVTANLVRQCLTRVKSGSDALKFRCLLYPRKRTFAGSHLMSALGRLCCKSRPVSRRPSAIGNNRIRKRGFVNQYSPFGLVLERLFLAPGPKIFLQQYRPTADSCTAANSHTYSITSSARESSVAGTSRPNAFAVLRLITSLNFVDCTTGRSAGLVPLRIRPT
jgi:hypothetical protein